MADKAINKKKANLTKGVSRYSPVNRDKLSYMDPKLSDIDVMLAKHFQKL